MLPPTYAKLSLNSERDRIRSVFFAEGLDEKSLINFEAQEIRSALRTRAALCNERLSPGERV
jgi:hypothetical protein